MSTTKKQKGATPSRKVSAQKASVATVVEDQEKRMLIPIELIDISPLNNRKIFDEDDLAKFSEELKKHGVLQAVIVRIAQEGRYELVVGERRYRASKLAGLPEMPATIRELTDQQVVEIQLVENLQRENPHPLHESLGIQRLQGYGKSLEQIAGILGKNKSFVYSRLKLAAMIEPMQLVFLANKINLTEAFAIASLAPGSQQELFDDYCKDWQKKNFKISNLSDVLTRFRYDLQRAPFDTTDKSLVPEAGACTKCPFNSAVLKSLFPEMAKQANCQNKGCYQRKCDLTTEKLIEDAFQLEQPPVAILARGLPDSIQRLIESHPVAKELPIHNPYEVNRFPMPEMPKKDDYENPYKDQEGEEEYDEEGYQEAIEEYHEELAEYTHLKESGQAQPALYFESGKPSMVLFNVQKRTSYHSTSSPTAKDVQEAIKEGKATVALLEGEVERLKSREQRNKELDREKVQLILHDQFTQRFSALENNTQLTDTDACAARWLIYQRLDYHTKSKVDLVLFPMDTPEDVSQNEHIASILSNLSEAQHAYLIRMALAGQTESKFPNSQTAFQLYRVAEAAQLDVQAIEKAQAEAVEKREARVNERLKDMEKKIGLLNLAKAE